MSGLDQSPAPPPGGSGASGGGRSAGMAATVTKVPEELAQLDRAVRLTGTVTGRGEGGTTRIQTSAGTLRVTPAEPLPPEARVAVRLQPGDPPDRARIVILDKRAAAAAERQAAQAADQAKARAAAALRAGPSPLAAQHGDAPLSGSAGEAAAPHSAQPASQPASTAATAGAEDAAPDPATRDAGRPGRFAPETRQALLARARQALPEAARPARAQPGTALVGVLLAASGGSGAPAATAQSASPGASGPAGGQAPTGGQPAVGYGPTGGRPAPAEGEPRSPDQPAQAATGGGHATGQAAAGPAGADTAELARQLDLARQLVARAPQAARAVAQALASSGALSAAAEAPTAPGAPAAAPQAGQAPATPATGAGSQPPADPTAPDPSSAGRAAGSGQAAASPSAPPHNAPAAPADSSAAPPRAPAAGQASPSAQGHAAPTQAQAAQAPPAPRAGAPGQAQTGQSTRPSAQPPSSPPAQSGQPSPAQHLLGGQQSRPVGLRLVSVTPPSGSPAPSPAAPAAGQAPASQAQPPAGQAAQPRQGASAPRPAPETPQRGASGTVRTGSPAPSNAPQPAAGPAASGPRPLAKLLQLAGGNLRPAAPGSPPPTQLGQPGARASTPAAQTRSAPPPEGSNRPGSTAPARPAQGRGDAPNRPSPAPSSSQPARVAVAKLGGSAAPKYLQPAPDRGLQLWGGVGLGQTGGYTPPGSGSAAAPPQAAGPAPPPAAPGMASTQLTGTVLGRSAEGLTLVRLNGGGTLAVDFRSAPEPGSELRFQVLDRAATDAALQGKNPRAAGFLTGPSATHPGLKAALDSLASYAPPTAGASAGAGIPKPGGDGLAGALFKILQAMRPSAGQAQPSALQTLNQWLGPEAVQGLQRSPGGGHLLSQLVTELASHSGTASDNSGAEWRWHGLPLLLGQRWDHLHFYLRHGGSGDRESGPGDDDSPTRFVVEMALSQWGPTQLEGLLRGRSLNLTVRTPSHLDTGTKQEMRGLYSTVLQGLGLAGQLRFQAGEDARWIQFQLEQVGERRGVEA